MDEEVSGALIASPLFATAVVHVGQQTNNMHRLIGVGYRSVRYATETSLQAHPGVVHAIRPSSNLPELLDRRGTFEQGVNPAAPEKAAAPSCSCVYQSVWRDSRLAAEHWETVGL